MKFAQFVFAGTALAIAIQPACAQDPMPSVVVERDGSHDFDFSAGLWKTHLRRRVHPLTGSNEFIELNGTVNTHEVWGGRAHLEEIEADGPNGHWEGLSLFLYDPTAHQWSQTFVNSKVGAFDAGLIGSFKNGRGELFESDALNGRSILVRGVWSDITPASHRYEESYSADGGKTWEVQITANKTRADPSDAPIVKNTDGSHEFDFDFGTWQTHSSRLMHPLTGANDWRDMDGITTVTPLWGGRANLAEYKAEGTAGTVELLALRLYNPTTKQWSINFAHPGSGTLGALPGIGEFKNGRVDFYDQEPINGKATLVRFSMWGITPDTARSEQAFSVDGGKTWEVNWVNKYSRSKN